MASGPDLTDGAVIQPVELSTGLGTWLWGAGGTVNCLFLKPWQLMLLMLTPSPNFWPFEPDPECRAVSSARLKSGSGMSDVCPGSGSNGS